MSPQNHIHRQDIVRAVRDLLAKNRIADAPVPVEKVARGLDIQIQLATYDEDMSGCLIRTPDEVIIGVNAAHHENRQRFTIAHEIGHFIFHPGEEIFVDRGFRINRRDAKSSTAEKPEEIEANHFASELLMPTDFLMRDLANHASADVEQDQLIYDLAHSYRVSFQAMLYKLVNIGFLPPIDRVKA